MIWSALSFRDTRGSEFFGCLSFHDMRVSFCDTRGSKFS